MPPFVARDGHEINVQCSGSFALIRVMITKSERPAKRGMIVLIRRALAITGGLTALSFGLVAAPAQAAGTCASGYVCMWEDPNYNGEKYVSQPGDVGSYEIDGWDGDNEISSVINRTGKCIRLYDNDGWSGTTYKIGKVVSGGDNGKRPNLEQNGFDNEAESYKIYSC